MQKKDANAFPDKNFFVESITKDIGLFDCVLDLIDNAIDSASSGLSSTDILQKPHCLAGIEIDLSFGKNSFSITDNAKGITLDDAEKRVFRFGSIKKDTNQSIGYYGIGLKRATFKIGKKITVESTTKSEKFSVIMDLPAWLPSESWTFPIDLKAIDENFTKTGVTITIDELYPDISAAFDTAQFKTKLVETIGRDYYFFIRAGVKVKISGNEINPIALDIKAMGDFLPGISKFTEDNVEITLISGCHSTADSDQSDPDSVDPKSKNSGWYVICNNRIIIAANKDDKTIWRSKQEGYTTWHPQYNGFIGFAFFNSNDLGKLPWTTTKRAVDLESQVYRTALAKMMEMTSPWIKYTALRKADLEGAKSIEDKATSTSLGDIMLPNSLPTAKATPTFPTIGSQAAKVEMSSINFKVEKFRADKTRNEIGKPGMTNPELGKYVFEVYYQNNVE